ncbi:MAG: UDP-N-acetylmuramoyl-L-alanine--D-glutamate ligase [Candidatus Methylacidiphilales bacterium]
MKITGQKWAVLGMGKSGDAAARLLLSRGAEVSLWDGRIEELTLQKNWKEHQGIAQIACGAHFPEGDFDGVVLSPGISLEHPSAVWARGKADSVIGEIELAYHYWPGKIIAVTGTNGKSTTTELVNKVLQNGGVQSVACGNIGLPWSTVVDDATNHSVAVVEVSSFQLEGIQSFRPDVAIYLNLTPDHLDRYSDMKSYGKAKERIFNNQSPNDFAVVKKELNLSLLRADTTHFSAECSLGDADYTWHEGWICRGADKIIHSGTTRLIGPHNAENIMATLAATQFLGVDQSIAVAALKDYKPLPHRMERVASWQSCVFINDSKATNPDAMLRALEGVETPACLIAGGKNKGFDFRPLRETVATRCALVILIGEAAAEMESAWGAFVLCQRAESIMQAVEMAVKPENPFRSVLLSPGCASFDMYKNFEDRGEQFKKAVLSTINKKQGELK